MSSESATCNDYLFDAIEMARGAGEIIRRYFRSDRLSTSTKLNEADVVTVADKESEAFIIGRIRALYPDHAILSEESGEDNRPGADYRWVIDPIDGTTNFAAGLPLHCVSIALQHKGVTVAGVVYLPAIGELFTAVKGEGAYLNGEPVAVASNSRIDRAVVSTGFPVDKAVNPDNNLDNVARVMPQVRGLRRLGSAAIDICYVAAGFLDAYWEMNLHEWDVAAALLILEEAGGVAKHYRHDRNISLLAASKAFFPTIEPLIK